MLFRAYEKNQDELEAAIALEKDHARKAFLEGVRDEMRFRLKHTPASEK